MLLITIANEASCHCSPRIRNSSPAKKEPDHANAAMFHRLRDERSTKAPTTGRMNGSEPAARWSPSTSTVLLQLSSAELPQPAARPATVIRYGAKSTVRVV